MFAGAHVVDTSIRLKTSNPNADPRYVGVWRIPAQRLRRDDVRREIVPQVELALLWQGSHRYPRRRLMATIDISSSNDKLMGT